MTLDSLADITTISSVTTATESGEIEQRIRQLKEDLSHRKEEVRRAQQEQKRRKRGLLQEKEEQLKKKLKVGWCCVFWSVSVMEYYRVWCGDVFCSRLSLSGP